MKGNCSLCLKNKTLQESHIIPRFVFKLFKRTTGSSLRGHNTPNKRVQDGIKEHLLCWDCEQSFNSFETPFCNKIFTPINDPGPNSGVIHYDDWAFKFAVSLSWRSLLDHSKKGFDHLTFTQQKLAKDALETWRKFLLGEQSDVGNFQQHLLPVDIIDGPIPDNISPYINRYLLRSVDSDIISSKTSAFVYTKIFRIMIFGVIEDGHPDLWSGTLIQPNKGVIGDKGGFTYPESLVAYWSGHAEIAHNALSELSSKQSNITKETLLKLAKEGRNDDLFRAIKRDIDRSGKNAFLNHKK